MANNSITPKTAGNIQYAKAEELNEMTNDIIETNRQLNKTNDELQILEDAIDQLSFTKEVYDLRRNDVRQKMQRLVGKL